MLLLGDIRSSLNKFNEAFAEDTQRGTDRLIRVALQDVTELKKDINIPEGKSRSEVKKVVILKRMASLKKALTDLNAFLP